MNDENPNESAANQGTAASELQNRATQDLSQVASQAKGDLDAVAQRAAQDARDLGAQAKEKVGEVTQQAKSFASDQKGLAADQINGIATAITKVADELENSEQPTIARYARDLASGISGIGKTVGEKDVDELMGLAQNFGRSQPVAFLGAAALAGFVASRFALASAHRRDTKSSPESSNSYTGSTSDASGTSYGGSSTSGGYGSTASSGSTYGSSTGSTGSSSSYGSSGTSGSSYGSSGSSGSSGSYNPGSSDLNRTGGE